MAVSTGARASRSAISATAGEDESVSEQVSREVFTTYECRSIDRGIVHPGDIAEPSSLRYATAWRVESNLSGRSAAARCEGLVGCL
jgi:hypothetical protein